MDYKTKVFSLFEKADFKDQISKFIDKTSETDVRRLLEQAITNPEDLNQIKNNPSLQDKFLFLISTFLLKLQTSSKAPQSRFTDTFYNEISSLLAT
jgi:hypothetical protein